jgi:hypothetical protein
MTKSRLPADKKRKLLTRVEDTTNPAYGRIPQERTIPEIFQNGIINLDSFSKGVRSPFQAQKNLLDQPAMKWCLGLNAS